MTASQIYTQLFHLHRQDFCLRACNYSIGLIIGPAYDVQSDKLFIPCIFRLSFETV